MNKPVPLNVLCFANGFVAVCDETGQQIPELQDYSFFVEWAKFAISKGYDVSRTTIECGHLKARFEVVGDVVKAQVFQ